MFKSAAQSGTQLRRFEQPERRLAVTFEKLCDAGPRRRLDQVVQIHKAPSQLPRQLRADRGLAGAHKSGQGYNRYGGSAGHAGSLQGRNAEFKIGIVRKKKRAEVGRCERLRLVALQDADGAGERGKFDFGEAAADRAEQAFGVLGRGAANAVRIGLQIGFRAVVDIAGGSLRVQVEGIGSRKANLDQAAAALHAVDAGADEIAVKQDVAGGGGEIHAAQGGLQDLRAAADGAEIEPAGALRADQSADRGVHDDVARDFLQVHVAVYGDQVHIAQNLFHVDQTGLGLDAQLGFFGHGELNIFREFGSLRQIVEDVGCNLDAVVGLLHLDTDLVRGTGSGNHNFGIFPGLHFNAAVRHVLDHDHRVALHREVLLDLFGRGRSSQRQQEQTRPDQWREKRKNGPAQSGAETHLSSRSCRAPSLRPEFPPSAGKRWKDIRAPWGRSGPPRAASGIP